MHVLNTSDIRKLDKLAQRRFSIPGLLLMEHASLGLAEELLKLPGSDLSRYVFLCGKGNNGGDGFAAARHLHNAGHDVKVILTGLLDHLREGSDAAVNAQIASNMGIMIVECRSSEEILGHLDALEPRFLVDAVLGTGLSSDVRGMFKEVFSGINEKNLDVTAVDIPSGFDGDTGRPRGVAIKARRTVTFAFSKIGFLDEQSRAFCGDIIVKGIGIPREVVENPQEFL